MRSLEPNIPGRHLKDKNSEERMSLIREECEIFFQKPPSYRAVKEDFPTLYHELPTLWTMIDEGKFNHRDNDTRKFLRKMIDNTTKVTRGEMTKDESDKELGEMLAQKFLYPLLNNSRRL